MAYEMRLATVAAQPTVVAVMTANWSSLSETILQSSRLVYAALDGLDIDVGRRGCNIVLYIDDVPNVEVGVIVDDTSSFIGTPPPVRASTLPAGNVCSTVHVGLYADLVAAHAAIRSWCAAEGHELAGPCWEIYGDWSDDPAKLETEVSYLLRA